MSDVRIAEYPEIRLSRFQHIRISGYPEIRISRYPDTRISRISGYPDIRISGYPDIRISGYPDIRISILNFARDVTFQSNWTGTQTLMSQCHVIMNTQGSLDLPVSGTPKSETRFLNKKVPAARASGDQGF